MSNKQDWMVSDYYYHELFSVLPKMTPKQLDNIQHEIRSMLLDLEYSNHEVIEE